MSTVAFAPHLLLSPRAPAAPLARAARVVASTPTWSDLEVSLPSSVDPTAPAVWSAAAARAEDLAGKLVLFRDRNGWCPYSERVWLALELKRVEYVTVLVDDDCSRTQPGEQGSLPRVQWPDGSTDDGSSVRAVIERIEREYPQLPSFFPEVSVTVAVARDSFDRFDGVMPRFTLPSSLAPYILACKIQRMGSFTIEECELGEVVPKYKFEVCLEEVEEILEEYSDGPFIAGASVSAADVYWAPFLERLAAQWPLVHAGVAPRVQPPEAPRLEALAQWFDAMDAQVPSYACRVKGEAATWRRLLRREPYLDGKLQETAPPVPDLPTRRSFRAQDVWAAHAKGRPYLAATPAAEVAATIVRNRAALADGVSELGLSAEDADAALREVCAALADGDGAGAALSGDARRVASHLVEELAVPRDLGVIPARALRSLVDDNEL